MYGETLIIKRIKALAKRALQRQPESSLPANILAKPIVITRDQHPISRKDIPEHALKFCTACTMLATKL